MLHPRDGSMRDDGSIDPEAVIRGSFCASPFPRLVHQPSTECFHSDAALTNYLRWPAMGWSMSTLQPTALLASLGDETADALPPALQSSLARHRDNLASMVSALQAAGLDEASIESHLSVLIDSYRAELAVALHHMAGEA